MLAWRSKTSRVHAQIKDFCAILSGLVVAQDYKRGQQLVADKDFDQNADFFQVITRCSTQSRSGFQGSLCRCYICTYMLVANLESALFGLMGIVGVRPQGVIFVLNFAIGTGCCIRSSAWG